MHTKPRGHALRELAVAVPCDPRTLSKALSGERISEMRLVAIRRTLAERGLLDLLPELDGRKAAELLAAIRG